MSSPEQVSSRRRIQRLKGFLWNQQQSREAALAEVKEKLTEDIMKTTAGKPQSWLEKRRTDLNEAWKKIESKKRGHPVTVSMFCDKGKHDRCTFDPNCSCGCHPKPDALTVPPVVA